MAKTPARSAHPFARTVKTFKTASGKEGRLYSLPALAKTFPNVSRLPVSIRIVLESVLRNCDGKKVAESHVRELANWQPNAPRVDEIPFVGLLSGYLFHPAYLATRPDGTAVLRARKQAAFFEGRYELTRLAELSEEDEELALLAVLMLLLLERERG